MLKLNEPCCEGLEMLQLPTKRRVFEGRRGAAAVEFALLLPFLLFLFVVAVDYSRVFYYTQVIENCARNGALYACDPKAPANYLYSSVQQAALADAGNLNPQPTVTSTTGTDSAGNAYVAVTVAWQFKTTTGYPGVPNTINLSRTVQMRQAP
jgi:Flp pilus assembly protein TadG